MKTTYALFALALSFGPASAHGATDVTIEPIDPNADHVQRWNWFARAVYALHKKWIAGRHIQTETRIGGYYREPKFYREVKYYDKNTGRLVSIIQWERERPDRIHWIEVYIYDDKGRVTRDFSAAFLPHSRTAPQSTFINLHAYNGGLHAFRQFDATDNRTYEYCKGTYQGKPLEISLWETDIIELEGEPGTIMTTPEYEACFAGLPVESAGKYLTPQ